MNIIDGRKIYPDPAVDGIEYEPSEWRLCNSPPDCICHIPTFTIFQIGCDEDAIACGRATLFDFSARIVHVCDVAYRPTDEVLELLGRGAIAVYLQAIGCWKPEVVEPDRPEHKKIKGKYPKPN